jgi:2,4-dienoyl-CoA reductase-like NADH-dependent reductase (Old Yellow Enzyme family)
VFRFPLEIFEAVRAAFPPAKPVGVKVSATDWVDGGWNLQQTVEYAKELKKRGADWVTASSGGVSPLQRIAVGPGYQLPLAEGIKRGSGTRDTGPTSDIETEVSPIFRYRRHECSRGPIRRADDWPCGK